MKQHQQKRLAYQRQTKVARHASSARSRTHHQQQVPPYETSIAQSMYASPPSQQQVNATVPSRWVPTSQIVLPTTSPLSVDGYPFTQTPSREKPEADPSSPTTPTASDIPKIKALPPTPKNNTPRPRAASRGYAAPQIQQTSPPLRPPRHFRQHLPSPKSACGEPVHTEPYKWDNRVDCEQTDVNELEASL